MDFVVTLIEGPALGQLTPAFADSMMRSLSMQDVRVEKIEWLKENVAVDLFTQHSALRTLDSIVQQAIRGYSIDAVVQPVAHRKKKLLIADMESTIIVNECLDELADYVGLKPRIAAITERAMNGELNFEEALSERVGLLKGLSEGALQDVYDRKVRLMPGAEALISTMKKNGAHCMLVSGGFDFYTSRIRDRLGFDEARSNRLEIENGKLTGRVIPPILGKEAKLQALQEACTKLGILPEETLAIGDGANDLPMLLAAGLGVAYHAKPTVRAQAKARINHGDLTALLWVQGYCHPERA